MGVLYATLSLVAARAALGLHLHHKARARRLADPAAFYRAVSRGGWS